MVGRGSMVGRGVCLSLGVLGVALITNISNITSVVISVVVDMLGPAVGKSNIVGTSNVAGSILGLNLVEGSLGVVISNSVLEGVWLWGLIISLSVVSSLDRCMVRGRGMVGRSSMDNRGMVRGRGMVGGSSMNNRGVVGRGRSVSLSVDNRGMVGRGWGVGRGLVNSMSNSMTSISSSTGRGDLMKTLVVVSLGNGGMAGSKGLGLSKVSHFSISL